MSKSYTQAPHALSQLQFGTLRAIFEARSGLRFDPSNLPLFQQRLHPRLQVLELPSFASYTQLLERGHRGTSEQGVNELQAAVELLTVGETYFFRHDKQMALLQQEILPALATANGGRRSLAIWSAGCSSGEELYSVAMLAQETGLFEGWNLSFLGADLSKERIEQARTGIYSEGAFRTTSNARRNEFFEKVDDSVETGLKNSWRIKSEIQNRCQFHVANLLSPDSFVWIGRVHLVLCRNVLIYLSPKARKQVLTSLHARLSPGGYLLLGHSETLQDAEIPVQLQGLGHDMAYQRLVLRPGASS